MTEKFFNIKQREKLISEWQNIMPRKFQEWFDALPNSIRKKLDFSIESTIYLEKEYLRKILRDKIKTSQNKAMINFKYDLDCIGYYIGETLIKNAPFQMVWEVAEYTPTDELFPMVIKSYDYYASPSSFFTEVFAISTANPDQGYDSDKNYLYDRYSEILTYYEEKFNNNEFKNVFVQKIDNSYQYFMLIGNVANPLLKINASLQNYFKDRKSPPKLSFYNNSNDYLLIEMNENYYFHLQFKSSSKIKEELTEKCSNDLDMNIINQSQSIVKFWADEDPETDFMNEALWVLQKISELPEIITIFDISTGEELTFS